MLVHRNRHTGEHHVIKLVLPEHEGELSEGFRLAAIEAQLHQAIGAHEFVASIFSWGTFDGMWYDGVMPKSGGSSTSSTARCVLFVLH